MHTRAGSEAASKIPDRTGQPTQIIAPLDAKPDYSGRMREPEPHAAEPYFDLTREGAFTWRVQVHLPPMNDGGSWHRFTKSGAIRKGRAELRKHTPPAREVTHYGLNGPFGIPERPTRPAPQHPQPDARTRTPRVY